MVNQINYGKKNLEYFGSCLWFINNQGLVQGSTSIFVVVFVDYFLIGWWDHSNSAMTSELLFKPAGMKWYFVIKVVLTYCEKKLF